MTKSAAKTSDAPASIVAMEQLYPREQRLIVDDLMPQLITGAAALWLRAARLDVLRNWLFSVSEKKVPGMWALFPCRKRFIQDKAVEALDDGIEAVVNLGAGMDTLAYREPALNQVPVWELDQAVNIAVKRKALERALGGVPQHVTFVDIDFDRELIGESLAAARFDQTQPTFYVLEAVTQYLSDEGVRATFDFLADAAPGSRLAFTYVRKAFIDGTDFFGLDMLVKQLRELWHFGLAFDEVATFLQPYGWEVIEHVGSEELATRYSAETGRSINGSAIEPVVYAHKLSGHIEGEL